MAGERSDRADVVEVRVREQDRLDAQAEVVEPLDQALGLLAGVDHDRRGLALARREEAVLGHRADGEAVDLHCFGLKRRYIQLSNQ